MRYSSRRSFLRTASLFAGGLSVVFGKPYRLFAASTAGYPTYTPPPSPRATINFNLDWKFLREDAKHAEAPLFDDSKWSTVSTPHSFNDIDSFRTIISHSGGDRGT